MSTKTEDNAASTSSAVENQYAADNQSAWDRVYTAIVERWPEIDQLELLECKQTVNDLANFVNEKVSAAQEEVRSVVSEFAPQGASAVSAITEGATDVIDRVRYEIDEAPVKSSLAGVMFGFGLGVLATTLYSSACRKAEMRNRNWF
ncbi:hypothetical protein [Planctomycetes bacterium K23_9]|uniref:Uncharacterized protein n=1 Tax=Stieleria marina TaxID=1930275 RepID=A0A517NXS0_9BACT|nr:hypothetical protein K239x_39270 [Planctomycetes bacterium K23_9]